MQCDLTLQGCYLHGAKSDEDTDQGLLNLEL